MNLGRHLPVGAETALRGATAKFESRFRRLEGLLRDQGIAAHDAPSETLETLWQHAKRLEADTGTS